MQLSTSSIAWHLGSIAAGASAAVIATASGQVDLYALYAQLNTIYGDIVKFVAMVSPLLAIIGTAYRTYNQKQVPHDAVAIQPNAVAAPGDAHASASITLPSGNTATVAGKVVGALILSFLFLWPHDSFAQFKSPLKPVTMDPLAQIMSQIASVKADVVAGVIADINAADADAATLTSVNDPSSFKDPISHACYPAAVKFLQSLPTASPPTGKFVLIQLFQKKRDFIAQLKTGLPVYLKLGCAPLLGDEIQTFVTIMGMVGVKIIPAALTAIFPPLAPVTLPALTLVP